MTLRQVFPEISNQTSVLLVTECRSANKNIENLPIFSSCILWKFHDRSHRNRTSPVTFFAELVLVGPLQGFSQPLFWVVSEGEASWFSLSCKVSSGVVRLKFLCIWSSWTVDFSTILSNRFVGVVHKYDILANFCSGFTQGLERRVSPLFHNLET